MDIQWSAKQWNAFVAKQEVRWHEGEELLQLISEP